MRAGGKTLRQYGIMIGWVGRGNVQILIHVYCLSEI